MSSYMARDRLKYAIVYSRYSASWLLPPDVCTTCLTGSARNICTSCRTRCHRYAGCRSSYGAGICIQCSEEIANGP